MKILARNPRRPLSPCRTTRPIAARQCRAAACGGNIVRAIQLVSTERAMIRATMRWFRSEARVPWMAVEVAEELGLDMVMVPPNAGVLSIHGLIASDFLKIYDHPHAHR